MRNSAHQQCWAFVFLLIYSGQSIPVHFGSFTQPCHWLKRLHLVIRWGKICFLVILQCSQTICFSGWSRHWKSWYFFSRSTRHDINSLGEHGKIVWRHIHCWIIETCKAGSQERYQPPPNPPPKKQQCKNQECLASYKKKLIACARVRCKRRVDSAAASPREYLVRRAAKNVISPPPKTPPTNPPKKQQCENQECLASYKKKLIACARVRCKRRVDSVAASPREYLVRWAAKNVISPPKTPPRNNNAKIKSVLQVTRRSW